MGTLLIDETEENNETLRRQPMVVGRVEFLPHEQFETRKTETVRELSRHLLLKHRLDKDIAGFSVPAPTIPTVAPCERCLKNPRFADSTMCVTCTGLAAERRRRFETFTSVDRDVTGREFLSMCLLAGLLLFFVVKFGAPQEQGKTAGKPLVISVR